MDFKKEVVRHGGDIDHDKTFCIFAVRVNTDNTTGQRKLRAGEPYYLMQGFTVDGNTVRVSRAAKTSLEDSIFNQSYKQQGTRAHLNFSAIVGMNGSGKSTLVEYMLRLINNFSASFFGEYKQNAATDRLHYLNGMEGELYYYSHWQPFCLEVRNDSVKLHHYRLMGTTVDGNEYNFQRDGLWYNNHRNGTDSNYHVLFQESDSDDAKYLFYSLVSNHSIYAYNANDYAGECDDDELERYFEKDFNEKHGLKNPDDIDTKEYTNEDKCWLHGLFHKNDGYQIPLVLNPFRKEGCIDINKENTLARERLVNLIVSPRSGFRKINDHLEVASITLNRSKTTYNRDYINKKLKAEIKSDEDYESIKEDIFENWLFYLEIKNELFGEEKYFYEDTKDYICYKTLKIAKQYRQYQHYFDDYKKNKWKIDNLDIQELIGDIMLDSSHITGKLFQAFGYLLYDIYSDDKIGEPIALSDIKEDKRLVTTRENHYSGNLHNAYKVCLYPSPIFDVTINVKDTNTGHEVDFETLSSGEKQLVFAVSSLLYHLNNIDSVAEDNNRRRIIYKHINVILEEVELYFHPEFQKRLVKYIIDGIGQLEFMSIQGINIILVTHSPFVLSDIPASNILALDRDGLPCKGIRSFGSNIHDMLKDSFFLQTGWIGDFAKNYIHWIIDELEEENRKEDAEDRLHRSIMRIDEPVMRTLLLDKYHEKYPETSKQQRIVELQKELEELQKEN